MRFRYLLVSAGLLVVSACALDLARSYLYRQAASAIVARFDGLTFVGVRAEPWRSEARLVGLDWRRAGASLNIGALSFTLPLLPFGGAALAAFGSTTAEDVTLEAGSSVYKIKRIELTGASLSSADLLQLFDSKSGMPIGERLAKITAATIAIPEMIVESKTGSMTQNLVYRDIRLDGIKDGKAADASVAGISFSILDSNAGGADGAYGRVGAGDIDLVLAARILSETRDQPDAPKLPLCRALSVDGFHLGSERVNFDLKHITATAIKARPPLHGSTPVAAVRNPVLGSFLDSFASDNVKALEIRLDFQKESDPIRLTIDQASVSQFNGPRTDAVEAQHLAFERASGRLSLEALSLRGLDLKPLTDVKHAPDLLGEDLRPDFEQITLTRLEARPGAAEETDAKSTAAFKVERFGVENVAQNDTSGTGLDISLDHLTAPVAEGGAFRAFSALGYVHIDLTSRLKVNWSESSRELAINSLSFEGADMGSLNVVARFANVTKDLASPDEQIAAAAARGVLIKKLDLHVENSGLVDRALAFQAKNDNRSLDETREADILKANLLLPALLGSEAPARALGSAVAQFIAAPKSFTLQAIAPDGVGIADLELVQTPGALLKKIDIKAFANR